MNRPQLSPIARIAQELGRSGGRAKPRAVQGELGNLMGFAREQLHEWFREKGGTVPYLEIRRRLKAKFGLNASATSLSGYYHKHWNELVGGTPEANASTAAPTGASAKTIVIRIEVPAGCRIDVSTEAEGAAERE